MDWLKEFLKQEWVKAALAVLVGFLVTFIPVSPEVQAAIAALIIGLLMAWAGVAAARAMKLRKSNSLRE